MLPKTWWGWVIAATGTLVALILLGVGLLLWLLPLADLRGDFEREFERRTGRDIEISGSLDVSFFPVAGFTAHDVRILNAPGGVADSLAQAGELTVGLELLPYVFSREIVIDRLILRDPVIHLELDREGRPNWNLAPAAAPAQPPPARPGQALKDIRLREVRIDGGRIDYFDQRDGDAWAVESPHFISAVTSLDEPMQIQGSAVFRGERILIDSFIERPRLLLEGKPAHMQATLESGPMGARFDGQVSGSGEYFTGRAAALGPSLRRVAAWLGAAFAPGPGFEAFDIGGQVAVSNERIAFSNAHFTLDALTGRGDVTLAAHENRPFISGQLILDGFDVNPYIAPAPQTQGAPRTPAIAAAPDAQRPWPTQPFDLSVLRALDANLDIITGSIRAQRMQGGRTELSMVLVDGYLASTIRRVDLYGGAGQGRLEINAREPTLRLVQELSVRGVRVEDLLRDAVNLPVVEGPADVTIDWTGEGANQQELFSSLRGHASLQMRNGALRGVDLGGVVETISNAAGGQLGNPNARSRFSRLSAMFAIAGGQMATRDFRIDLAHLGLETTGVLDIGRQQLNMRLIAREGVVAIPFVVRGGWNALEYRPDLLGNERRNVENAVNDVFRRAPPAG